MAENNDDKIIEELANEEYKYGFTTDIDTDYIPAGLNEDTIRLGRKWRCRTGLIWTCRSSTTKQ